MTISYNSDVTYASAKLTDSMISLNGTPVQVRAVNSRGQVTWRSFQDEGVNNLTEFDLEPFKLGYCNNNGVATYLRRIPARHWRQGLRTGTLSGSYGVPNLLSKYFRDCVSGFYPCLEESDELISCGEVNSVAFSRNFSLKKNVLSYKGRPVGSKHRKFGKLKLELLDDFKYLNEVLEQEAYA